jgi:hypothetical protein
MPKPPSARVSGLCAPTVWSHAKGFGQKPCRGGRTAWTVGDPDTNWRHLTAAEATTRTWGDRVRPTAGADEAGALSQHTTNRSVPPVGPDAAARERRLPPRLGPIRRRASGLRQGSDGSRLGVSTSDAPLGARLHGRRSAVVRVHVMGREGATIRVQERAQHSEERHSLAAEAVPTPQRRRRMWTTSLRPTPRCGAWGQSPTPRCARRGPRESVPMRRREHQQVARVWFAMAPPGVGGSPGDRRRRRESGGPD